MTLNRPSWTGDLRSCKNRFHPMKDDHDIDDTADRDERPPESPSGDLDVTLEDVLPYLCSTGRRPRTEDTATGR